MSNGDGDRFIRLPRPPQPSPFAPGINRERDFERFLEERLAARRAHAVPAFPLPTPPITPQPFPTGPAANDPVFNRAGAAARGIVLRGAGVLAGGIFAIEILKQIGEVLIDEKMREAEALTESEMRRRARLRLEKPVVPTRIPVELPDIIDPNRVIIPAPRPEILPAPAKVPRPVFEPSPVIVPSAPVPLPSTVPAPQPIPRPIAPKSPVTPRSPVRLPRTLPAPRPISLPRFFPIGLPARLPFRVPKPKSLTDLDPLVPQLPEPILGSIVNPLTSLAPQPQPQTQRRCKEVKRRRRRKGKCRQGYFEELAGKTRYTTWRTVDCKTGKETRKSVLKNKGFDTSNVLNFPRLGL